MRARISASVGRGGVNRSNDVRIIQAALNKISPKSGGPAKPLAEDGICGPKTIEAIQKFQLHHFGWQGADGRVDPDGPTLAKLNQLTNETPTEELVCRLSRPCPLDAAVNPPPLHSYAGSGQTRLVSFNLLPIAAPAPFPATSDADIINKAFQDGRKTLSTARNALSNLLQGFRNESTKPLNDFQKRVLISCGRWLKIDTNQNNAARQSAKDVIQKAITLMDKNLSVRTTAGAIPPIRRLVGLTDHANTTGDPDKGVNCGDPFFNVDGPRCRRDVLTHEFFHLVKVNHGAGPGNNPSRASITTPAQALDSADHLAQLVSELMDGTSDACLIAGR
jgi:peptidoglycan hydrolase-like protein with peptidoglycan-binding domain